MDAKPQTRDEYDSDHVDLCEQTLVTLLRWSGPWKESMYLIGGLVPHYLIDPAVAAEAGVHYAGTQDVDLVLDLVRFSEIEAYKRLEQNLKSAGFERMLNNNKDPQHWRWRKVVAPDRVVVVDLLKDTQLAEGGLAATLPGEKHLSALGIPGAHLAIQDHVTVQVTADLLDGRGIVNETIRVANIVPFIALKALAYEDRLEQKDANDLIYCLQYYKEGPHSVAMAYHESLQKWPDEPLLHRALDILRNRFASNESVAGDLKDGPISYAKFQDNTSTYHQDRVTAASVVERFLEALNGFTNA